jgi:hypothetical protein
MEVQMHFLLNMTANHVHCIRFFSFFAIILGLLAPVEANGDSGIPKSKTGGPVDFYLFAHTDDWPLFMGDRVYSDIRAGHKIVLVYMVAGYTRPNWQAWENAANSAVICAVDDCPAKASEPRALKCAEKNINAHSIYRCTYMNTISYFMRLPDGADFGGDNGGAGWPVDNYESLRKLQDGVINSISTVDRKTTYAGFSDLSQTLRQIMLFESPKNASSVWVNMQDPNTKSNPRDNSDHTSTGCAVSNAVRGLWRNQRYYVDYDNRNQASELPPTTVNIKRKLAMAFNEVLKAETGTDLYNQGKRDWDSWMSHTVFTISTVFSPLMTNILAYDSLAGEGSFYALDERCDLTFKTRYPSWRKSWEFIIPGNFTGGALTDLIFYDKDAGEGALLINRGSGVFEQKSWAGWRKTWTQIVPGKFIENGQTQLLFYDQSVGEAAIYGFDQQGEMKLLKQFSGWSHTWTFIVPGDFGGDNHTDLVFYDKTTGAGYVFINDGKASFINSTKDYPWRKTWSMIIPGNFGGDQHTDLLFYEASSGDAAFLINEGEGAFSQKEMKGLRKSWGSIVPGRFLETSPCDDLLFYDIENKEIAIFRIRDIGNAVKQFKVLNRPSRAAWKAIMQGKFFLSD